jgi:hypothetical protein
VLFEVLVRFGPGECFGPSLLLLRIWFFAFSRSDSGEMSAQAFLVLSVLSSLLVRAEHLELQCQAQRSRLTLQR